MPQSSEQLSWKIIECLSQEYQSIWLVDLHDLTMNVYWHNSAIVIDGSVETTTQLKNYNSARRWYIDTCIVPEHRERVMAETDPDFVLKKINQGHPHFVDYRRINNGETNFNQMYFAKINDESAETTHFLMGFRNVDVTKRAEIDELTNLYNRRSFVSYAEKMLRDHPDEEFNLVLSDFVNFKQINENYGPAVGDAILKGAANYLISLRQNNILVGRYGGDQFVCLVGHDSFENFIMNTDSESFGGPRTDDMPSPEVKLGVCPGIKAGDSILLACDRAHIAADSIKHKYNQVIAVYSSEIRESIDRQNAIEQDMREALEKKQFQVYYQPKHDAQTGKVVGAEALIRWIHPTFGFMSPGEFIPIFERNGFIVEADYFVYRKTCQNLRRWMDKGLTPVPISVNASKLTFESPHMLHRINNSLAIHNLPGKYIHVEITESLMSDNTDRLVQRLSDLRKQDIQIELDDFGSGYSSINMLSALPLDVIKLDMSFMQQFGDSKRAKVLEACVSLAKNLGYKTVSEGVETKEQLDSLKVLGVDAIQGFYFSKPLPEDEFEKYLQANS